MSIKSILFSALIFACSANAGLVHYNFEGVITTAISQGIVSEVAGAAKNGQKVNAIYSVDTSSQLSASTGQNLNMVFDYAILSYSYYIGGRLIVADKYRINRLQFAKGWVNGSRTDFIEFTLDGGVDNYNNNYGLNAFGEYVDSYLYMADPTATVFDYLKFNPKLPSSLQYESFSFGYFDIAGSSLKGNWSTRHKVTGIRADTIVTSAISAPMTGTLLIIGTLALSIRRIRYGKIKSNS